MELKSPGYKSQLIFTNFDGEDHDRGDYYVIKTLSNPNFFWGNLLIFNRAPKTGDFSKWSTLFKKEFNDPRIYHSTFTWDKEEIGEVQEFLDYGYELETTSVLTATKVMIPPKYNNEMVVKKLAPEDWDEMIQVQIASADDHLPQEEWFKFYSKQKQRFIEMEKGGYGHWFGGYIDNKLVTGLGIYKLNGLGRFQSVCTHPDYQRRGLCGTLVYLASLEAFKNMGVTELVMCADPDYHAIKIYESVGFKKNVTEYGLCWWDKNHSS